MTLVLSGPEQSSLAPGMVLSDPGQPVPVSAKFKARIVVFNLDVPITKGTNSISYVGAYYVLDYIKLQKHILCV